MTLSSRRFLFLVRHAPLHGARVRETLDLILTVAAFDQWVGILFLDDGVLNLVPAVAPSSEPSWLSMWRALDLYDIRSVLVENESLHSRGLGHIDLAISATVIPAAQVPALLAGHDRILVC